MNEADVVSARTPLVRRRWLLVPGLTAAVVLVSSSLASAHVTVHPSSVPRGSTDVVLTFLVPNERDDANTVKLQVFFPSDHPLLGVLTAPIPGWTSASKTERLAAPVHTDDGSITSAVTEVTWTATNGGLGPGQFGSFAVSVGTVPDVAGALVFKALQTYSSGEVVRWIQVPDALDPTPADPAPAVALTSGASALRGSSSPANDSVALAALACAVLALAGVVVLFARRASSRWATRRVGIRRCLR